MPRRWCRRPSCGAGSGQDFWLKLENMQPIGAFKLRGALNAVAQVPEDGAGRDLLFHRQSRARRGLCGAGAGDAGGDLHVELVPQAKVDGIRALGPRCASAAIVQDDALAESQRLVAPRGWSRSRPSTIRGDRRAGHHRA
jgi:threonine dehydratase